MRSSVPRRVMNFQSQMDCWSFELGAAPSCSNCPPDISLRLELEAAGSPDTCKHPRLHLHLLIHNFLDVIRFLVLAMCRSLMLCLLLDFSWDDFADSGRQYVCSPSEYRFTLSKLICVSSWIVFMCVRFVSSGLRSIHSTIASCTFKIVNSTCFHLFHK